MTEMRLSRTPRSVRPLFGARVGMACRAVAVLICGGLAATTASARAGGPEAPDPHTVRHAKVSQAKEQPVRFEENRGQADPRVRYLSRARDYTVALTDDEALLLVRKPTSSPSRGRLQASDLALVRMRLAGASPTPRITAREPLPGNVYYAGADASRPLTPIDTFARVEYAGVYPGIDLVYYGNDHRLEFDFEVAPFADPSRIALSLEGADGITLTDAGDLSMRVGGAEVRLEKPIVYQERDGRRIEVAGAYLLPADDTHTVRFRLGSYDRSLPLVIDPTWMTVFGSTDEDWLSGFAVDSAGHPRLLGETFDPATFPFTQVELGLLTPPNCFLTKLNGATGLTTYTILFGNTQRCEAFALAPNDVAYFAAFVYPNSLLNNQGTTVTAVDDSSGVPVIRRFGVSNYDSTAPGEGVAALAVNSLGHVFLLGPCRIVGAGDPPLQLSGYNETPDPAQTIFAQGCTLPNAGSAEMYQPLLTVVDSSGTFLYGSFLSPGEFVTRYGLAADDADRAYIVGAQSEAVAPTVDAYRPVCPAAGTRGFDFCGYLMVLDTTTVGPASLVYASYLWNTEDVETVAVRLGPAGAVYLASEGRVFDDFPGNRPTDPSPWPYSLYPTLREGVQLARFNRDANDLPSVFDFATVFDPSRGVAALNGYTARDALADLRLFPSGAPAVASVAYTSSLAPLGIVTTFDPSGDRVGEVWTQNLGTRTPVGFGVATGSGGRLFLAGQIDRSGAQDSDVFVEQIDAVDPGANRPPTVRIFENLTTVYADSPTAGALLQINAIATDPEGDPLTYSWTGPFTDNPVTDLHYLIARVPLGLQQTVTVTVNDGHGNVVSASRTFDVVGTPFVGTTATPIDSALNGLAYNYAPITITATGIGAGGGNAYLHTRLDQNPPIPAHLQGGSPPLYFDLSTDAALIAPIALCVDTRGMSLANPANVRLYQYQQSGPLGAWVDITSAGYPQGNQLCGQSDTLGTFAIFYPQVPATAVQTIAGNGVLEGSNDGIGGSPVDDFQDGPATSTPLPYLYGGAYDRANNQMFLSGGDDILRLNLNDNTIARVAGNGVGVIGSLDGPGGDLRDDLVEGGDAFATYVGGPAELVMSPTGDVVFFDRNSCRIRRLDVAQGRLFAVAGNGTCGSAGDGSSATLASLSYGQMAYDAAGNLFLADVINARVRRIDALTNVIDTVAGDGTFGVPQHGASARSGISLPLGLAFDSAGHLLVAGGMHLLRISTGAGDALVDGDADEVISVLGGCNTNCLAPFNGDTLAISHPQVYLPGMTHLTVAQDGSVMFGDSFRIRRITAGADGIVTGASDEIISTVAGYYDWATLSQIPNFNGDTFSTQSRFGHFLIPVEDAQGGIIVVDGNNFRVRRFGLPPVGPSAVTINTLTVPSATEGDPYSATITAAGGTGAGYNWSISAGALPAGLALAQTGTPSTTISGTPTEDGTFNFTVLVTDSGGATATRGYALVVAAGVSVVEINVTETIVVGDAVGVLPAAMIGIAEQIIVTDAPAVLPSAMIGVSEQIVVSDALGVLPSAMIGVTEQITVTDSPVISVDNVAPVLSLPAPIVTEAQTPAGAVVTFSASATDDRPGPVQVSCSPASGSVFPFNGSSPTTTNVTCTATDAGGNVVTGSFSVTVQDTTAPQVLTAQITVAATEATGARANVPQAPHTPVLQQIPLLAAAIDAGDQNPARVSVEWVACGNTAQVLGPIANTTLYPVGPNCFFYVFRDGSGNTATGVGTITVSPPIGGHVNVPNVPVTATDLGNVPLPVTATFLGLDQPGLLTAVPPQFIPPPPAGMIFAGPPFELHSTALAQAPVMVCMRPPFGDVAERLLALEFFQWVDRTQTSTPAGEICGRPGELGTFALVRRDLSGFTMTMTPVSAVQQAGLGHRVFINVSDNSDPTARVMLQSRFAVSAEFRNPQAPNSPLSVTLQRDASGIPTNLTVSLGTGPNGELISTARQVADGIHAHAGFGPVFAWTAENTNGEGIVAPIPLAPLTRLQVSTSSPGVNTSGLDTWCYVTLPALCVADIDPNVLPFAPFTLALTAYLDVNRNQVADAGELTAPGEVTWVDVTPPFLHVPANITVSAAGPAGTAVSFTVPAFDNVDDGELPTSCSPPSGSTFPIGTTTVTCTATDSSGNVGTRAFTVTVTVPPGQPTLHLPGNMTVLATGPSGAAVNYTAYATAPAFGGTFQIGAFCTPFSGSTFPIGTTTVSCTATNPFSPLSPPATGSFTVTVVVGTPSIHASMVASGRDATGFWIDLRLRNVGSGHAQNVRLVNLTFRTLMGTGSVSYNAAASGPIPLALGNIDAGADRPVRLYLNVPPTVRRFAVSEAGTFENVVGTAAAFSATQAIIP